ncbi:rhodoquinone biosynthesis methyltransferase RquA [Silvimonas iriomotensis]|uniref:Methyltransferase n=1 Tax=Silvimonas iriomotensis TaxID=449662 RepID=A0ABQ2P4J5_9NEIS|nr:rhodoquinone biosynthesis methyltransferase RquA [Silvimonas iriomotensis]GGP17930.1 methyltransferase [Silvimonas iriomotensis]
MPPDTTTALPLVDPDYDGVPEYLIDVYDWAYVNPRQVKRLDHNWVVKTLLFGNDQRLMRAYLNEIKPGDSVWQVAHVYGDLVTRAAQKVGPTGTFHLTDITPAQVRHGNAKLSGLPWASVFRADAASFASHATYDVVCSFFLLHEVPESKKHAIVDHMLARVPPGGKAVFVDYHRPRPWHPVGWLLRLVNAWLEPFAFALWHKSIPEYARHSGDFCWTRRTFFGGVYQCTIATRPHR